MIPFFVVVLRYIHFRAMSCRCQRRIVSGVHNRRNLGQEPATETRAEARQPPPVVVGEPHALAAQLRLQDTVLFTQVLDNLGPVRVESIP